VGPFVPHLPYATWYARSPIGKSYASSWSPTLYCDILYITLIFIVNNVFRLAKNCLCSSLRSHHGRERVRHQRDHGEPVPARYAGLGQRLPPDQVRGTCSKTCRPLCCCSARVVP
jgi:hypothetical protein